MTSQPHCALAPDCADIISLCHTVDMKEGIQRGGTQFAYQACVALACCVSACFAVLSVLRYAVL